MRHAALIRAFTNGFDTRGTLTARAHQGLSAGRLRIAREVAIVIGISLSMAMPLDAKANNLPIKYVKDLARYQLTDKQEACHHEIIYRESRWDHKAVGNLKGTKQVYGLYQMKTESLKNASTVKQFWMYWHYVTHRYGVTQYDEPNYCNALHHLKTKGWQ
jgi:hypothetical protein